MARALFVCTVCLVIPPAAWADDWPRWLGPRGDSVWREQGILARFPAGGPKVLWRAEIKPGYTGPAVAEGRVYVMDREEPPRDPKREAPPKGGSFPGKERILCLDARDGRLIWKHEYDCPYTIAYPNGPRTTPIVAEGWVYTLGSMGDLLALDAATGKVLWAKNVGKEYQADPPVWGWSAHPLLDGDKLICLVGGEGSAAVAFDRHTGKELWKSLTVREIGYAPPVIHEHGGRRQLIVWHTEAVNSLDPESGKLNWSERFPEHGKPVRPGITVATPRPIGPLLLVSSPHHGSLLLDVQGEKPRTVWRGMSDNIGKADGLHCLMSSPVVAGGHIYGICSFGELRCLKLETAERLWETFAACVGKRALFATSFLVQHEDRFLIFTELGDLIIARLTPRGYEEIDRAHLLEPLSYARGRNVVWSHPAFANRCMFARNDKELICVQLAQGG